MKYCRSGLFSLLVVAGMVKSSPAILVYKKLPGVADVKPGTLNVEPGIHRLSGYRERVLIIKSHANTVVIYLRMIILGNIFPVLLWDRQPGERMRLFFNVRSRVENRPRSDVGLGRYSPPKSLSAPIRPG